MRICGCLNLWSLRFCTVEVRRFNNAARNRVTNRADAAKEYNWYDAYGMRCSIHLDSAYRKSRDADQPATTDQKQRKERGENPLYGFPPLNS